MVTVANIISKCCGWKLVALILKGPFFFETVGSPLRSLLKFCLAGLLPNPHALLWNALRGYSGFLGPLSPNLRRYEKFAYNLYNTPRTWWYNTI